jgi:hypothetical protein
MIATCRSDAINLWDGKDRRTAHHNQTRLISLELDLNNKTKLIPGLPTGLIKILDV